MNDHKALPTQDEIYKLVKDNNRMLKAMRRDAFIGGLLKLLFWVVVLIIIPYLSWLFIQPYLEAATGAYQQVQGSVDTINSAAKDIEEVKNSFPNIGDLFNQFGGGN